MPQVYWCSIIWNSVIPPSKSFISWRLLHRRLSTDENLQKCGCITVSVCGLYYQHAKSSDHIFFQCSFAKEIWSWFSSIIQQSVDLSSFESILSICNRSWSPQILDVISAAIVNIIWAISFCRNKIKFDNKRVSARAAISMITASTSLTGNLSKKHVFFSTRA